MKLKIENKLNLLWQKIKKIKHIEIYFVVFLIALASFIYFSSINGLSLKGKSSSSTKNDKVNIEFSSSAEYTAYIENKLESVLTNVKNVGNVEVMASLEKGFEYIYVTEEKVSTTSNGTSITSVEVVMVDGKPVLKEEIYPIFKGIVVVASGASDMTVKMNILSLIQTVIDIDNSKINILVGN